MTEPKPVSLEQTLSEQYATAIDTLGDMRFRTGLIEEEVPFDRVLDGINSGALKFLEGRRDEEIHDILVIAPSIEKIGVVGNTSKPGLIPRFDHGHRRGLHPTGIRRLPFPQLNPNYSSWDLQRYFKEFGVSDRDPIHDNMMQGNWNVGIMLGDLPGSGYLTETPRIEWSYSGLVYNRLSVHDQRKAVSDESEKAALEGRVIRSANIAQIFVNIARVRRQNAETTGLLTGSSIDPSKRGDAAGTTDLIHYAERNLRYDRADGHTGYAAFIPAIENATAVVVGLDRQKVDYDDSSNGVRRILEIPVN